VKCKLRVDDDILFEIADPDLPINYTTHTHQFYNSVHCYGVLSLFAVSFKQKM